MKRRRAYTQWRGKQPMELADYLIIQRQKGEAWMYKYVKSHPPVRMHSSLDVFLYLPYSGGGM